MKKEKRLDRIRKRQKNDLRNKKKVGVAIRTSSSIAYGWIDDDFKTEVDELWWNTSKKKNKDVNEWWL